jgi:uncharacterized membrane protein YgdD (TMEM256/DUF423 family)
MKALLPRLCAFSGFLAVALGAFGAHKLEPTLLEKGTLDIWETAVLYHLVHTVALLFTMDRKSPATVLWLIGICLFSGSLYIYALTQIKGLVFVTPVGGLFLLAGWAALMIRPAK